MCGYAQAAVWIFFLGGVGFPPLTLRIFESIGDKHPSDFFFSVAISFARSRVVSFSIMLDWCSMSMAFSFISFRLEFSSIISLYTACCGANPDRCCLRIFFLSFRNSTSSFITSTSVAWKSCIWSNPTVFWSLQFSRLLKLLDRLDVDVNEQLRDRFFMLKMLLLSSLEAISLRRRGLKGSSSSWSLSVSIFG